MPRLRPLVGCLVLLALTGCGSQSAPAPVHPAQAPAPAPPASSPLSTAIAACPQAVGGHGAMGACAPSQTFGLAPPRALSGITYPDLSNNDPIFDMGPVKRHGHPAFIGKVNQGTGFIDSTYARMVASARANHMAVGGYDFVQDYSSGEVNLFIARLRATGTCSGHGVLPPTLDVEFGTFSYSGLMRMISALRSACGRVQIYTGAWYWQPHAGCQWPSAVIGWVSGYPSAPRVCGMPSSLFRVHQFTDRGFNGVLSGDMNVWLGSPAEFASFANLTAPKPPMPCPKACQDRKHLTALYAERTRLRGQLSTLRKRIASLHDRGVAIDRAIRGLGGR